MLVCAVSLYGAAGSQSPCSSPYIQALILCCECSARIPTAKAFASIGTWSAFRYVNVSLALCPIASTALVVWSCSQWLTSTPHSVPSSTKSPVTFAPKRTSPPISIIKSRIPTTTCFKISVPICGLLSYKMCAGAPNSVKIRSTSLFLPYLSFTSVLSFPSEKVPAPPSPNCTLDSGLRLPPCQYASTSFERVSTSKPRSSKIGW